MVKKPPHPDKIPINSPSSLTSEFNLLSTALAQDETEHTWEGIDLALKRFHAVVRGGVTKSYPELLVNGLREKDVVRGLVRSMITERTRLSSTMLDLLASLTRLGALFSPLLPLYLPPLLRLLCRTNKLYISRATATLSRIIDNTRLSDILKYIVSEWKGEGGKSASYRLGAVQATLEMVEVTGEEDGGMKRRIERRVEDVEWVVKSGAVDRDAKVRDVSRKVFEVYRAVWPERVDQFVAPMTPIIRRYLAIGASSNSASTSSKPIPKQPSFTSTASLSASTSRAPPSAPSSRPPSAQSISSAAPKKPAPPIASQAPRPPLSSSTSSNRHGAAPSPPPVPAPIATTQASRGFKPTLPTAAVGGKARRAPLQPPILTISQQQQQQLREQEQQKLKEQEQQRLREAQQQQKLQQQQALSQSTSSSFSSTSMSATTVTVQSLSSSTLSKSITSSTSTLTKSTSSSLNRSVPPSSSTSAPFRPTKPRPPLPSSFSSSSSTAQRTTRLQLPSRTNIITKPRSPVIDRKLASSSSSTQGRRAGVTTVMAIPPREIRKAAMCPLPEPDEEEVGELREEKSGVTEEGDRGFCQSVEVESVRDREVVEGVEVVEVVAEVRESKVEEVGVEKVVEAQIEELAQIGEAEEVMVIEAAEVEKIVEEIEVEAEVVEEEIEEVLEELEEDLDSLDEDVKAIEIAIVKELGLEVEVEEELAVTTTVEAERESEMDIVNTLEDEESEMEEEEEGGYESDDESDFGGIRLVEDVAPIVDSGDERDVFDSAVQVAPSTPSSPHFPAQSTSSLAAPTTPINTIEPAQTCSIIMETPVKLSIFPIRLPGGRTADLVLPTSSMNAPESPCPPEVSRDEVSRHDFVESTTPSKTPAKKLTTPPGSLRRSVPDLVTAPATQESTTPLTSPIRSAIPASPPATPAAVASPVQHSTTPKLSATPIASGSPVRQVATTPRLPPTPTNARSVFYPDEAELDEDSASAIEEYVADDEEGELMMMDETETSFVVPLNDASLLTDEEKPISPHGDESVVSVAREVRVTKTDVHKEEETSFEAASMETPNLKFHDSSSSSSEDEDDNKKNGNRTVDAPRTGTFSIDAERNEEVHTSPAQVVFRRSLRSREVSVTVDLGVGKTPGKTPGRGKNVLGETQG